jgi:hypothetical protein
MSKVNAYQARIRGKTYVVLKRRTLPLKEKYVICGLSSCFSSYHNLVL